MFTVIKHWMTARDNLTWSFTKLLGMGAGITMIVKFWKTPTPDYQSFGIAITGIIAALAYKYSVEKDEKPNV